jgi:hypothetical protein
MLEYRIGNTKSRRVKNSRLPINISPSTIFMINKAFEPLIDLLLPRHDMRQKVEYNRLLKDTRRHIKTYRLIEQIAVNYPIVDLKPSIEALGIFAYGVIKKVSYFKPRIVLCISKSEGFSYRNDYDVITIYNDAHPPLAKDSLMRGRLMGCS